MDALRAPLKTVSASSGLYLWDSLSTMPFGFVTVALSVFSSLCCVLLFVLFDMHCVLCAVYHVMCSVCSELCSLCCVLCTVYVSCVFYAVCIGVQCVVCSLQRSVCSVQCAV